MKMMIMLLQLGWIMYMHHQMVLVPCAMRHQQRPMLVPMPLTRLGYNKAQSHPPTHHTTLNHKPHNHKPPQPPVNIQYPPADRIWDWQQGANFAPSPHHFDEGQSGIWSTCTLENNATELECFKLFFDEPLMEIIVRGSNPYFDYTMANTVLSQRSRLHLWKETTVAEMYIFFASIMLMPHVYKHCVKPYWSRDRLISTTAFSDIIPVNQFVLLLCTSLQFLSGMRSAVSPTGPPCMGLNFPGLKLAKLLSLDILSSLIIHCTCIYGSHNAERDIVSFFWPV
nr:uncharacterized protein LOC128693391 [Cherax quadricarinatus]